MDEESFDDAMEDGVVVVTFEAELDEIPGGLGRLLWPQLHVEGTVCRIQHHFPLCRRFQYIDGRHVYMLGLMVWGRERDDRGNRLQLAAELGIGLAFVLARFLS